MLVVIVCSKIIKSNRKGVEVFDVGLEFLGLEKLYR